MEEKKEKKLGDALLKVALGYSVAEVTEEYAEVDGALKLMKRKKMKKDVPPDLKAVQMLLGEGETGVSALSDEELEAEKNRLLEKLREEVKTAEVKPKKSVKKVKKATKKKSVKKTKKEVKNHKEDNKE